MEVLGIDIGGSGIKGAPVNIKTGELIKERYRIETPQPATPLKIAGVIKQITEYFNWEGKVGCGFPAVVRNGEVMTAANIDKSNISTNVEQMFSESSGCRVKVLNDADAAGFAETKYGAGKSYKGLILLLTIGTGIGSVIVQNGNIVQNTELGHIYMKNGQIAEQYASDAVRKRKGLKRKQWAVLFNEYLQYVESLINPDLIILGGGASKKFHKYEEIIDVTAELKPAELLNNAGIVGAAAYAAAYGHSV